MLVVDLPFISDLRLFNIYQEVFDVQAATVISIKKKRSIAIANNMPLSEDAGTDSIVDLLNLMPADLSRVAQYILVAGECDEWLLKALNITENKRKGLIRQVGSMVLSGKELKKQICSANYELTNKQLTYHLQKALSHNRVFKNRNLHT